MDASGWEQGVAAGEWGGTFHEFGILFEVMQMF